jgi:hypothetical protein
LNQKNSCEYSMRIKSRRAKWVKTIRKDLMQMIEDSNRSSKKEPDEECKIILINWHSKVDGRIRSK